MNKQQITKQYSTILICLALVSMLIMFVTPFITAFEMDLGIFSGSEKGIDYVTNIFDFEENDDKDNSSTNDWFDKDKYSDYTLIEDDIEKWIMRGLVAVLIVYAIVNFLKAVSVFYYKNQDSSINKMLFIVKVGLVCNIIYYIFCMYIILKGHEWEFEAILSGDAIVKTKTYLPMILQIIVFAGAMFLYKHWENVMSGKGTPLNFGFAGSFNSKQATQKEQAKPETGNTAYSARYEMEKMELLKRYKELLDSGIITEEEFNEKKRILLGTNHYDQADHSTRTQTQANAHQNNENECSRVCKKCGYPLTSSQQVCPHCGTQLTSEKETEVYGMKWYKFLIYFSLFASAVLNAISAIMYFTGASYGDSADLVYDAFPSLQAIDVVCGMAFIGLAIMALVTRSALNWNKRKGPKLLCTLYILNAVVGVLYAVVASAVTEEILFDESIVINLIFSIVMAIANHIYFTKRKDMFTY